MTNDETDAAHPSIRRQIDEAEARGYRRGLVEAASRAESWAWLAADQFQQVVAAEFVRLARALRESGGAS